MSLAQVIGHSQALKALRGALRDGTVGSAYLFFGPEGVGKQTTALEFARALLCQAGQEDSCGRCDSCRHAGSDTHPDLMLVAPEKRSLSIGQVRRLQKSLFLTPSWGKRKAALLDHAESMRIEAANAMLMTLEEPPPGAVIILISSNLGALPATVISRCRKVGFGLLEASEVEQVLLRKGWAGPAAREGAALAEGSPGRVLTLDGDSWKKRRTELGRLLESVMAGDRGAALGFVEGRSETREGVELDLQILLSWVRRMVRRRLGLSGLSEEDIPPGLRELDLGALDGLMGRLIETQRLVDGNSNVKLALGSLFLEWTPSPSRTGEEA